MSAGKPIKLKPCPFCGSRARLVEWRHGDGSMMLAQNGPAEYIAECCECGASAGDWQRTAAGAARVWNRREPPKQEQEQGKREL